MISGVRKGVWQTFGVVSSTPPPRPEHLVLMAVFACRSCPRDSSKKICHVRRSQEVSKVTTFRLRHLALILQLSASVWTTQLKYSLSRRHGGCTNPLFMIVFTAWSGHAAGERTIPVGHRRNAHDGTRPFGLRTPVVVSST